MLAIKKVITKKNIVTDISRIKCSDIMRKVGVTSNTAELNNPYNGM